MFLLSELNLAGSQILPIIFLQFYKARFTQLGVKYIIIFFMDYFNHTISIYLG